MTENYDIYNYCIFCMMVTSIKCITVKDYLTCIYNGKKMKMINICICDHEKQ